MTESHVKWNVDSNQLYLSHQTVSLHKTGHTLPEIRKYPEKQHPQFNQAIDHFCDQANLGGTSDEELLNLLG